MSDHQNDTPAAHEDLSRETDTDDNEDPDAVEARREARRDARDTELREEQDQSAVERHQMAEEIANPNNHRDEEPYD